MFDRTVGEFRRRTAALLLSRQALRPSGRSRWIRQVAAALDYISEQSMNVVSSVDLATYDAVTAMARERWIPMRLLIPVCSEEEFHRRCDEILHQFDLDPEVVRFNGVSSARGRLDRAGLMRRRDDLVCDAADLLLPISIRRGGSMAARLESAAGSGMEIDRRFAAGPPEPGSPIGYNVSREKLTREAAAVGDEYIIHWTRGANGPWPGERRIDFWRSVIAAASYPRSAMDTLINILASGRLIGSGRHMPRGTETVSFSDLSPGEATGLMRYRARYREMSFEPYGIGIHRSVAEKAGIVPVTYLPPGERPEDATDAWRCQTDGRRGDWRAEREYRCLGDIDLDRIGRHDLIAFTCSAREAEAVKSRFGIRAVAMFMGEAYKAKTAVDG